MTANTEHDEICDHCKVADEIRDVCIAAVDRGIHPRVIVESMGSVIGWIVASVDLAQHDRVERDLSAMVSRIMAEAKEARAHRAASLQCARTFCALSADAS